MIRSGGALVKSSVVWTGSPSTWGNWPSSLELGNRWSSYGEIYRQQLWVAVVVNKRSKATARLPLKVYERTEDDSRIEARDHPYARLLRRPNERHSAAFFWLWTAATFDVYGEAFWGKIRDPGGRPVQIVPLHPSAMNAEDERNGETVWTFQNGRIRIDGIRSSDLVHFKTYNPASFTRGLSPLEPLRATLENEDAARRATSSFWKKGARPGYLLSHPGELSEAAGKRIKKRWDDLAGGADQTGRAMILEEGMKAERMMLTAEEAQYIETRRLNREEVCAAYDMPPPAVQILDRATFSNITEQMRSLYRETMAPLLGFYESEMEMQLRGGTRPGSDEPDFGDGVYSEFLLDEVLRGAFEQRAEAYKAAEYMTIAEKRRKENLPFIEGTDRIFLNSASLPLEALGQLPPAATRSAPKGLSEAQIRALMGRLSRPKSLEEVNPEALIAGLNGEAEAVLACLDEAKALGEDVGRLRDRLKVLGSPEAPEDPMLTLAKAISSQAPPVFNIDARTPDVTVNIEPPPPAVTNVDARTTVAPAASPVVTVNVPEPQPVTKRITRDANGNIETIEEKR